MDNHCETLEREITPKVRKAELLFLYMTRRLSCSIFLPSIIKIFQRVFDLQSGHEINGLSLSNITKGDTTKSKKGRAVIYVVWSCSSFLPSIIKMVFKLQSGHEIFFQIKQRVIKVRKAKLSFLYATRRLVLFYISTKYHHDIPKDIQVTERTRSFTPTPTPTRSVPKTI